MKVMDLNDNWEYRAVENRCAAAIGQIAPPTNIANAMTILLNIGFSVITSTIQTYIVELACKCVGRSKYKRAALPSLAPEIVDCSSFVKWLYGQCGIWLPRRSIQQHDYGVHVGIPDIKAGDLVFATGYRNYHNASLPDIRIGHVGLYVGDDRVIHAASSKRGIVEDPFSVFDRPDKFRGAARFIPYDKEVVALRTPRAREIETSDDLRWIIRQNL